MNDAWFRASSPPGRSHLYHLMSWLRRRRLKSQLDHGHLYGCGSRRTGTRILKGLASLHRLSIVHRDIKPDNLHLDSEGRLRILDLGVAVADSQADGQKFEEINNPGTPSTWRRNSTPPNWLPADEQTDLYAVASPLRTAHPQISLRRDRTLPGPEIRRSGPADRYRPDIPAWLEAVLLKAVAREPKARFRNR